MSFEYIELATRVVLNYKGHTKSSKADREGEEIQGPIIA